MSQDDAEHRAEVERGERFQFGANWSRFLSVLNQDRIDLAQQSLVDMLEQDSLEGLTFIDVGSGSGLFSLCARNLGAKVFSFDYDPQSVACTRELRRRYFPDDEQWTVEQGSVLNPSYLSGLGQFDIVYSWGVLHHTGDMWNALNNVKPLVKQNGRLFIAIYNDLGQVTDNWARIKRRYNKLPQPFKFLYALTVIAEQEARSLKGFLRNGGVGAWIRSWADYDKESTRGMSKWHDWIDWIGGHPYERATVEEMVNYYAEDGFRLSKLVDRIHGYGCNEFVFERIAPAGTVVESRIPGGSSLVRRFGRRVLPPFERDEKGLSGKVPEELSPSGENTLWLFENEELLGPAEMTKSGTVRLPTNASQGGDRRYYVVAGKVRESAEPFVKSSGHMWHWKIEDLEYLADTVDEPSRSPVFLLRNGIPLGRPHSVHAEIAKHGDGRFSHWGHHMLFAPNGNIDPNSDDGIYQIFVPEVPKGN